MNDVPVVFEEVCQHERLLIKRAIVPPGTPAIVAQFTNCLDRTVTCIQCDQEIIVPYQTIVDGGEAAFVGIVASVFGECWQEKLTEA